MLKTIDGKTFSEADHTLYYALDCDQALDGAKAFLEPDGKHGVKGAKTNYTGSGGKLPTGHLFNVYKVGFMYRLSTGAALSPATLSKLVLGTYSIRIGENNLKSGSLSEFFDSAVLVASGQHAPMQTKCFIPLLGDQGDWWDQDEILDLSISLPAMETGGQIIPLLKGLYYTTKM